MNIRNTWFLVCAGLLSLALVGAAACGGTSSSDKTATAGAGGAKTTTTGTGDQAPADQQKVVVQSVEPQFYDPHRSNFEQDIAVERMLFRGLYNLADDGSGGVTVVDEMARGEPQVSGNDYTVKLKSGLKWSDGQPLTAKDFVFGIQQTCSSANASEYQYILGEGYLDVQGCDVLFKNKAPSQEAALRAAVGIKATDDQTLVLSLTAPNDRFKTIMSLWAAFPLRQDVFEKFGDQWTAPGNIVTNGPFTLTEVVAKDHVTLKPNPNYPGKKPALQEIKIRFIDDFSTAFRAYQSNELDMTRIQPTDIAVAKDNSDLKDQVVIDATARITTIEMQMNNPALSNFNLRLALARSIDRQALIDQVYDGLHKPATYWVVQGLKGYQGNEPFENKIGYDLDAAKEAIAKAKTELGGSIPTLKLTYRDSPERRDEFAFLQNAWKQIGVDVTPEFVDSKARSAIFNQERFELFQGGWQLDYPDIENPLRGLFNTGGGNNHYNCSLPEIDAAFDEAAKASNDDARIKAYQKAETLIVENLCGMAPMYQDSIPYMVSNKIGGVVPNGTIDAGQPGNYCVECWFVKKT